MATDEAAQPRAVGARRIPVVAYQSTTTLTAPTTEGALRVALPLAIPLQPVQPIRSSDHWSPPSRTGPRTLHPEPSHHRRRTSRPPSSEPMSHPRDTRHTPLVVRLLLLLLLLLPRPPLPLPRRHNSCSSLVAVMSTWRLRRARRGPHRRHYWTGLLRRATWAAVVDFPVKAGGVPLGYSRYGRPLSPRRRRRLSSRLVWAGMGEAGTRNVLLCDG